MSKISGPDATDRIARAMRDAQPLAATAEATLRARTASDRFDAASRHTGVIPAGDLASRNIRKLTGSLLPDTVRADTGNAVGLAMMETRGNPMDAAIRSLMGGHPGVPAKSDLATSASAQAASLSQSFWDQVKGPRVASLGVGSEGAAALGARQRSRFPDPGGVDRYASPMRRALDEIAARPDPGLERARIRDTATRSADQVPAQNPAPGRASATPVAAVADIGRRVRAARKAMGMSQQRFADLAGVGRRFLVELEHGKPSLEIGRVFAVCRAAGLRLGFVD